MPHPTHSSKRSLARRNARLSRTKARTTVGRRQATGKAYSDGWADGETPDGIQVQDLRVTRRKRVIGLFRQLAKTDTSILSVTALIVRSPRRDISARFVTRYARIVNVQRGWSSHVRTDGPLRARLSCEERSRRYRRAETKGRLRLQSMRQRESLHPRLPRS